MVAEKVAVCWYGFADEFTEISEQSLFRCFAEVIRGQDDHSLAAQLESGSRQRNGFTEAGRSGPAQDFGCSTLH